MAKKFGLGGGIDALMGTSGLNADDISELTDHFHTSQDTDIPEKKADSPSKTASPNLPQGILISLVLNLIRKNLRNLHNPLRNTEFFRQLQLKMPETEISTLLPENEELEPQKLQGFQKFQFS